MRRFFLVGFLVLGSSACRPVHDSPRPYQVYPQKKEFFHSVINPTFPAESSGSQPIVLHEDNYPIQLKLFDDGRFQYTLRKLGDGWGTWKYSATDGYIDLYAERTLFVMQMQIRATDPQNPEAIALEFSDRFGPKYLVLSK